MTAYAGIPIVTTEDHAVRTVCVMDTVTRDWTDDQLAFLAHLATLIADEIAEPTGGRWTRSRLGAKSTIMNRASMTSQPDPPPTTIEVEAQDLEPGDHVMDAAGRVDYEVHGTETAQARVQIGDTAGLIHTYSTSDVLAVQRD